MRRRTRKAFFRSCLTHQAKSSSAEGSNSKLRTGILERNAFCPVFGSQQSRLHRLTLEQVGGFSLGLNLVPQINGHDDADRIAFRIVDILERRWIVHKSALPHMPLYHAHAIGQHGYLAAS